MLAAATLPQCARLNGTYSSAMPVQGAASGPPSRGVVSQTPDWSLILAMAGGLDPDHGLQEMLVFQPREAEWRPSPLRPCGGPLWVHQGPALCQNPSSWPGK